MRNIIITFTALFFFSFTLNPGEEGKELYITYCGNCHGLKMVLVGPPLSCIGERVDHAWVHRWIKDPDGVLSSGDAHAIEIYEKFSVPHPVFEIDPVQVDLILGYLESKCE